MLLALVLGFLSVAVSGVVYRYRGARAAGLLLTALALVSSAVSLWIGGRQGVGDLVVGGLAGLPVLIGGALVHSRRGGSGEPSGDSFAVGEGRGGP